ncbi:MAG: HgcAB-associated protein [Methanoregula sp.]
MLAVGVIKRAESIQSGNCEKADIKTGDKLALISWEKNGSICCLALMKVENLNGMVKDVLGPLMHDTEH